MARLFPYPFCGLFLAGLFVLFGAGCITTPAPVQEYALARAALEACKSVEAARYSSGFYHRALETYSRAEVLYKEREYQTAQEMFIRARIDFERAENSAQVQRKKSGEVL